MAKTDDEQHRGAAGYSEIGLLPGEKEQLDSLYVLSEQPGIELRATIDHTEAMQILRGISSTVTITGVRPDGTIFEEPIETSSGTIHRISATDKKHWAIRSAFNTAFRTALLAQPRAEVSPQPTSAKEAGR